MTQDLADPACAGLADLGVITRLAMIGETHNRLSTEAFLRQVEPLMASRSIQLFRRGERPIAWVAWRFLSTREWQDKLAAHGAAAGELARVRSNAWLDFWVRPHGCDADLARVLGERLRTGLWLPSGLSWHDPSADGGAGRLHLNVPLSAMSGR